jgi:lambda family phage portal protein
LKSEEFLTLSDRVVTAISPTAGLKRIRARAAINILDTSFSGASRNRRSLRNWGIRTAETPDEEVLPELPLLRARARDLYKNNPIGGGAIKTVVTNVIGPGLQLQSRMDRSYLKDMVKLNDAQVDALESRIERLWHFWADYTDADASRRSNFSELQDLAFRTYLQAGDCFTILPLISRPNTICDLRIEVIDADRVSDPLGSAPSLGVIIGPNSSGIELGKYGDPVAYQFEITPPGSLDRKWTRVLAYGPKSGRPNVIHLYKQERPGQRRGIPYLAPVIETLKQIGRYTDSELMAAVVSAMFTTFVESNDPANSEDILGAALPEAEQQETEPQHYELGSGAIIGLNPGEKVEFANPGRPNTAFDPFVSALLRQVGMSLEIPYELLVKQFTASYSAARASILEAWKFFKSARSWFSGKWCQPIYEELLTTIALAGLVDLPGYFESVAIRRAYCGTEWMGPAPGQLNPVQETKAARDRVVAGFSTKTAETLALNGGDYEDNMRQRAKEESLEKLLGLNMTESDTTTVTEVIPTDASGDPVNG